MYEPHLLPFQPQAQRLTESSSTQGRVFFKLEPGKVVYLNQVFWLALDNALNNLLVALVGSGLSVEDGFLTPKVVLLDSECH
jgi:hypothetical protein